MPVTIEIPTAFRRFTDGAPRVDCSASTVAEALDTLTKRFPGLSRHVRDDSGQIRQFLNIYLRILCSTGRRPRAARALDRRWFRRLLVFSSRRSLGGRISREHRPTLRFRKHFGGRLRSIL